MNKTTALVFFSIILVGLLVSVFSLNKCGKKVEVPESPVTTTPAEEVTPPAPVAEPVVPKTEPVAKKEEEKPETPTEDPAPPAPVVEEKKGYASPALAMKALAGTISERNFEGFVALVGEEALAAPIKEDVKALIEGPELQLDPEKPVSEISKSASLVRWALNFVPAAPSEGLPAAEPAAVASRQLYADLESIGEKSVDFKKISLPLVTAEIGVAETAPATDVTPAEVAAKDPADPGDPLSIAHTFSKAVVARDFTVARALSDPEKVTDERVAALMIAVEEGGFSLKEDRPLVVTLSREDITWVLTRIESGETLSEFALELGMDAGKWRVGGLTFSKVLSALAEQAGGGDIAYSPIVEDPTGGDSLVLYFEFDSAGVTPRGKRQLAIIADILSQGAERVIRINGHADALGTDQYNASLSDGRAEAIRQALVEMGVSPDQVITEAFGESKPRRPNFNPDGTDNPTGRSQNRRAEVYLDF